MLFRGYHPLDTDAIAAVFRDAILHTGSQVYDAQQVAAWSAYPDDRDEFQQRLSQGITLVAVEHDAIAAFGQLDPPDHISLLYTSSQFARRGCATEIYQRLEAQAIAQHVTRLHTEASHIAKHFFLKMGFQIIEAERVMRRGVEFERFRMEKVISPSIS
jgi:putative acetyltransferase